MGSSFVQGSPRIIRQMHQGDEFRILQPPVPAPPAPPALVVDNAGLLAHGSSQFGVRRQPEERGNPATVGAIRGKLKDRRPLAGIPRTAALPVQYIGAEIKHMLLVAFELQSPLRTHAQLALLILLGVFMLLSGFFCCLVGCFQEKRPPQVEMQEAPAGPGHPCSPVAAHPEQTSAAPAAPGSGPLHLCPHLVVPQGNVCRMMVPLERASGSMILITDICGLPVFRAFRAFRNAAHGRSLKPSIRRVVLMGATSDDAFAFCWKPEGAGLLEFEICHQSGGPFAAIRANGPALSDGFLISTINDSWIRFQSYLEGCTLSGTDEHDQIVATIETCSTGHSVCIGQLVDVGLILLSLLGVQALVQTSSEDRVNMLPAG